MELVPFLFFAFIAFQVFKGFTKTATKSGGTAKSMMRRMHEDMQKAEKLQDKTSHIDRYRQKSPTQRGRESLQNKGQSPWGENGAASPGARVAANYLQKSQTVRKKARRDSHKNPKQHGRRGSNMDQNRNRTDEWGQRGDSGLLSGQNFIILLVIVGVVLFVLSQIPAS